MIPTKRNISLIRVMHSPPPSLDSFTTAQCLPGMWMIWKHRNYVVFNAVTPSDTQTIARMREEAALWEMGGLFKGEPRGMEGAPVEWAMSE